MSPNIKYQLRHVISTTPMLSMYCVFYSISACALLLFTFCAYKFSACTFLGRALNSGQKIFENSHKGNTLAENALVETE